MKDLDDILGPEPDMLDAPGCVPAGASDWEQAEIRRHWRNALHALREVTDAAIHRYNSLRAFDGDRYDYRPMGGTLGYQATQAEVSLVNLSRVLDGAVHRAAMTTRGEPTGRELVLLSTAAQLHDDEGANPDGCPCVHTHCILTEPWVPAEFQRNGPTARVPKPAGS